MFLHIFKRWLNDRRKIKTYQQCERDRLKMSIEQIPSHLRKYYKAPTGNIADRCATKEHLFQDLWSNMICEDRELCNTNNVANLLISNLGSHPDIHRGYYDTKLDGVYYVTDIAGDRIGKDRAFLTIDGHFISKDSYRLLNKPASVNFSERVSSEIATIMSIEDINRPNLSIAHKQLVAKYKESYYFTRPISGISYLIPFDFSVMKFVINENQLLEMCKVLWFTYVTGGRNGDATYVDQINVDTWHQKLRDAIANGRKSPNYLMNTFGIGGNMWQPVFEETGVTQSSHAYYHFGKDSWFGSDFYLLSPDFRNAATMADNIENGLYRRIVFNRSGTTMFYINNSTERQRLPTHTTDITTMGVMHTCPFPLYFYAEPAADAVRTTNKLTLNNEGKIMQYTSKVDAYKKSFLMTDEETKFFEMKKKNLELKKKQHKERIAFLYKYLTENKMNKENKKEFEAYSKEYHANKTPTLNPVDAPIFMGFELELNTRAANHSTEGVARVVKEIADSKFGDHCIMKYDGSIGPYGFELVSIPATLEYHRKMLEEHFFGQPNAFHTKVMSTDKCGLHVHISKKCMTRLDAGKLLAFINAPDNASFMDDFANRTPNRFCAKWDLKGKNKNGVDCSVTAASRVSMTGGGVGAHHDAVNVQNAATIEIRIFKSTNNKNNLLRKLEFCEALVKFARCHSAQQMTVYDFVQFVLDKVNRKSYPNLLRWLGAKNLVEHERQVSKGKRKLLHIYGRSTITKPNNIYHKSKQADQPNF